MLLECLGAKAVDDFNEDGSEQATPGEAGGRHAAETCTLMLPGAGVPIPPQHQAQFWGGGGLLWATLRPI